MTNQDDVLHVLQMLVLELVFKPAVCFFVFVFFNDLLGKDRERGAESVVV